MSSSSPHTIADAPWWSKIVSSFEPIPEWPDTRGQSSWSEASVSARFKAGYESFDFHAAKHSPETAFQDLTIRDTLHALGGIGLKDATVLDFGCGNGLYRILLAAYPATAQWNYVGVDINEEVIEWCRQEHSESRFECIKTGRPLPFGEKEFDVVLACGVIQCIRDYAAALQDLGRIATNYLLVNRIPLVRRSESRIWIQHVSHPWGKEEHPIHILNRNALEAVFTNLGMSVVYGSFGHTAFPVSGLSEEAIYHLYLLRKS